MTTREITLTLPEDVASEAEAQGLLKPESLEQLLREVLRQRRVTGLFSAAARLSAVNLPPLTEEDVEAEIQAARADSRTPDRDGG